MRKKLAWRQVLLASLIGLLLGGIFVGAALSKRGFSLWTERPLKLPRRPRGIKIDQYTISRLAKAVSPAVVFIRTSRIQRTGYWWNPRYRRRRGLGTGFLIHRRGYILTNYHVVGRAQKIRVKLKDESLYTARIVGQDPPTDVALIKINSKRRNFPVLPLGDSDKLLVGEQVVAIGNPVGLAHTVTQGIVSATGRREMISSRLAYYNFIQTDAAINQGNSGGPLINLKGQAVGINTLIIRTRMGIAPGIGFAIPINMAKKLLPHLKKRGRFVRSWLGVAVKKVTPGLARKRGMRRARGALITVVERGGPAHKAGIRPGDLLLSFNKRSIKTSSELPWLASTAGVGQKVRVVFLRGRRRKVTTVRMGLKPGDKPYQSRRRRSKGVYIKKLGLFVRAIPRTLMLQMGLSDPGVLVTRVLGRSPASGKLRPADVILSLGTSSLEEMESPTKLKKVVKGLRSGQRVRAVIWRRGTTYYITFRYRRQRKGSPKR